MSFTRSFLLAWFNYSRICPQSLPDILMGELVDSLPENSTATRLGKLLADLDHVNELCSYTLENPGADCATVEVQSQTMYRNLY